MNFSQILLCEFAIGSNCESEAKANAFEKLRSESEAKSSQFCAKRSEANSLRFAIFRNRANSHCEFGALPEITPITLRHQRDIQTQSLWKSNVLRSEAG
jgi:hypothetical protein